ncbi:hypothetical protein PAXRUDRAFT_376650 [Paxillus rubicundulus Ve08.2h10]|uniref:Uncharacterized protein n=1 Tax=Paxillus rubicundulus Ve08.2h10 TaxID=930991 RepID=A0A0D0DYX9_9AGAM|nr:hypothetical protein PAXRUDRAFT_376650 [Paxillus rubicundulus Ve08.2h10]
MRRWGKTSQVTVFTCDVPWWRLNVWTPSGSVIMLPLDGGRIFLQQHLRNWYTLPLTHWVITIIGTTIATSPVTIARPILLPAMAKQNPVASANQIDIVGNLLTPSSLYSSWSSGEFIPVRPRWALCTSCATLLGSSRVFADPEEAIVWRVLHAPYD